MQSKHNSLFQVCDRCHGVYLASLYSTENAAVSLCCERQRHEAKTRPGGLKPLLLEIPYAGLKKCEDNRAFRVCRGCSVLFSEVASGSTETCFCSSFHSAIDAKQYGYTYGIELSNGEAKLETSFVAGFRLCSFCGCLFDSQGGNGVCPAAGAYGGGHQEYVTEYLLELADSSD